MASLNKVLIIGNLTRDPELRYIPTGTAVVNLRVAVNRRFRDRAGEQKEETCFITAVVWDKQAEACNQYLNKGSAVFVEGRLQSRSWDAPDGTKRNTIEIRAERVQFLNSQKQAGARPEGDSNILPATEKEDTSMDSLPDKNMDAVSWPSEEG